MEKPDGDGQDASTNFPRTAGVLATRKSSNNLLPSVGSLHHFSLTVTRITRVTAKLPSVFTVIHADSWARSLLAFLETTGGAVSHRASFRASRK